MVLYLRRKLAILVPGSFERCGQTRKCLEAGMMTSKLLWFENIRKDLGNKPMKSDTLKIKQSFKSKVTFPGFGIGIVSVCSTVCLLLLLFFLRSSWSAWFVMTQTQLLQDWEQVSALLPVKSLPSFVLAGETLC